MSAAAAATASNVVRFPRSASEPTAILSHPESCRVEVPRGTLLASIKAAAPAMCRDETRFHICGLALVATNGHVLARVRPELGLDGRADGDKLAIVPAEAVKRWEALLKGRKSELEQTASIMVYGRTAELHVGGTVDQVTLIDAQFPPYDSVIPERSEKADTLIGLDPDYLAMAGKAARAFVGRDHSAPLRMSIAGELDPVRLDCEAVGAGDFTFVVMPMRI